MSVDAVTSPQDRWAHRQGERQAALERFTVAYQRLNLAQKQAVDTIEGPVLVIAGPGTGKTQVLVTRIANILLKTDTPPSAILALTFTDSAAQNMRERLVGLIGQTGYAVRISTFHAFCSEIISSHPEYFPIDRGSEPISDLERYDLIRRLVAELELQRLQPMGDPYFYIRDIISVISDIKREGVKVGEFQTLAEQELQQFTQQLAAAEQLTTPKARRETGLPTITELKKSLKAAEKNQELAQLYLRYEHELRAHQRFDFDDMIGLMVTAFQDHELLLSEYQENLQYFLVDEYQDTNSAQDQVLSLLGQFWGEAANVFAVGDPNQAIFRFQGASVENMLAFVDRYPSAVVVTLNQGYRCPQEIYDAAAELISHNQLLTATPIPGLDLAQKLQSAASSPVPALTTPAIQQIKLPSQTLEVVWIAEQIQQLIQQGVAPETIAIIYRHNADRLELIEALSKWQIGFEIDGGGDVLSETPIQQLLTLLRVVADLRSANTEVDLLTAMLFDWSGLPSLTVMKLSRAAYRTRKSIGELLEVASNSNLAIAPSASTDSEVDITPLELVPLQNWYKQILNWGVADASQPFTAWFEQVLLESGFLAWIQILPDHLYQITVLNSLYKEVKALVATNHTFKLHEFLAAIETMQAHHLAIKVDDVNIQQHQVKLTTAHRAKGQEWQEVFIVHCTDKKWGNVSSRQQFQLPAGLIKHTAVDQKDKNEDERRLFYVALTRAKHRVWLTYPETYQRVGRSKATLPSQFLGELGQELTALQTPSATFLATTEPQLVKLLSPVVKTRNIEAEQAFFRAVLKNFKLSVTALNKYLRDPQAFVLEELLRVPRAKSAAMAYGTAIHTVLEKAFRHYLSEGELPPVEKSLADFETALTAELLSEAEFKRRLAHGQEVLKNYLATALVDQPKPIELERFFGSGANVTILDDIKLTGRVDRIDWVNISNREVRVIDYKTGHPKSDNEIIGVSGTEEFTERELALPATIRGPYQRQLVFYKLLTQLDKQFPYTVTEGVFEFVEPRESSGAIVRRKFTITDEAVTDLQALIKTVMAELRSLAFISK